MEKKDKHIGLRCTDDLLRKLKYISEYEGRSINGEIIYLINSEIRRFEAEVGKIEQKKMSLHVYLTRKLFS